MAIDTYIAFGGVALLGLAGFCAAWFSGEGEKSSPRNTSDLKAQQKKEIVAKIEKVEEELVAVSSQVRNL